MESGKINFKTKSHGTIHSFKIYFATVFSVGQSLATKLVITLDYKLT